MTENFSQNTKPRSERVGSMITRLPQLVWWRRLLRRLIKWLAVLLVAMIMRLETKGLEKFPKHGPALLVSNHLGDADVLIGLAIAPSENIEAFAKSELYDFPVLGKLMDAYGVIWIHRGQPDRRALRTALQGLGEGRFIAIAPEGRESLTGELEDGTGGAAYLALKAEVPIVPITLTGSENRQIFGNMKRLQRTRVSLTVGSPFHLQKKSDRRASIRVGIDTIMQKLADQLPASYRGQYS